MSLSDIFGGNDGGTTQVPSSSTTTIKLPEHIEQGSKDLFESAIPLAERPYPQYPTAERIAPFNPDQMQSFQMTRDMMGQSQPIIDQGLTNIGLSTSPIGQADIDKYMNPYIQSVIDASVAQVQQQAARDKITRDASLANRGSYLNEDRRGIIDNVANEGTNRTIAEMVSNLMAGGYSQALQQAGLERGRYADAAGQYGQFAPLQQASQFADVSALGASGGQQQALNQNFRDITYQDFQNQFYYPEDQANFLLGILSGVPSGQTRVTDSTQPVGTNNSFGTTLGGIGSLFGGLGSTGLFG